MFRKGLIVLFITSLLLATSVFGGSSPTPSWWTRVADTYLHAKKDSVCISGGSNDTTWIIYDRIYIGTRTTDDSLVTTIYTAKVLIEDSLDEYSLSSALFDTAAVVDTTQGLLTAYYDTAATVDTVQGVLTEGGYLTNSALSDSSITLLNATAWRMFFSNATTTAIQELAFGASGKVLKSNGASSAPTWETDAGAGLTYFTEADDNDTSVFTATGPNTTIGFDDQVTLQGNNLTGVGTISAAGNITLDKNAVNSPFMYWIDVDDQIFSIVKYDDGSARLANQEGAIHLYSSADNNDYLKLSTTSNIITLETVASGDGDLVIKSGGGDISFDDDNLATTGNLIANGNLSVGNTATTAGVLTLLEDDDDGSNFASFSVPALGANTVYVLPPDDGDANEQLQTNGSGTLTWEAAGGGLTYFTEADDNDTSVFTATGPNTTVGFNDNLTMQGNNIIGIGDVIIGGSSALNTGKVSIDGDADQVQLTVQGNGTQTADILVVEKSDGTDIFNIQGAGEAHFTHVAEQDDDYLLLLSSDAAGKGGVKTVDIDYTTGAMAAADEGVGVLVNIDQSASAGGDVHAFQVLATTSGAANTKGLVVGVGVSPVSQQSGSFTNLTFAESRSSGGYSDWVVRGNSAASDTTLWGANNDTVFVGFATTFEEIEWLWNTVATKDMFFNCFYSTGAGAWTIFAPIDGTNGATNNGIIAWERDDLSGWSSESVDGDAAYWVAIIRTRSSGTGPTEDLVQVSDPINYEWDASGNVIVNSLRIEGTEDAYEQIITSADPSADRTFTFPDDQVADLDIIIGNGAGTVIYAAMSGDATMDNAGAVTIGVSKIDSTNITNASIAENDLEISNAPAGLDGYLLSLDESENAFTWVAGAGGGNANRADIRDTVDAWFQNKLSSNNTETGIAVTYQSGDSTIDFVITQVADVDTTGTDIAAALADRANIHDTLTKSFVIQAIDTDHDFPFWMTEKAITLIAVSGVCIAGTNVVGALMEYDNDAANPVTCNGAGDWTFTTGEERTTSIDNASIDAGDYLGWKTTSVSGVVTFFTLTFEYIEN